MKQWQLPDSVGESTVGEVWGHVMPCDMSCDDHMLCHMTTTGCSAEVVMETGTVCGGTVACLLSTLFGEQNGTVDTYM